MVLLHGLKTSRTVVPHCVRIWAQSRPNRTIKIRVSRLQITNGISKHWISWIHPVILTGRQMNITLPVITRIKITISHVSRCKKSFFNYSNVHAHLHFLTLTAKMHIIERGMSKINIVISKIRIFGFSVFFSSVSRYFSVFSIPMSVAYQFRFLGDRL